MALGYDSSFAPYVIPAGVSLREGLLPDPRWAALIGSAQLTAVAAELAVRLEHPSRPVPVLSGLRRRVGRALAGVLPVADGAVPCEGDAEFAWARVAGTNPFSLVRVRAIDELPEALRLADPLWAQLTDHGPSLHDRIRDGAVYVARYDALRVQNPLHLQPRKFVAPVAGLFVWAPELQAPYGLVPLAIEVPVARPDGPTRAITPLDGQHWLAAKRLLNATDVNAAELLVHLARAHYMTAPFSIALRRMVPAKHPLRLFLGPHLRFGTFVDRMAWSAGFRDTDGVLIKSLGGTAAWSREVAKSLWYSHSFREQHFERDLEARGVHDAPFDYPYRDDGRLIWAALRTFSVGFVDETWADDAAVLHDEVVQAFVGDLTDPRGGNVRGLTAGPRLDSRAELAEILTQVLFVAGPLHALTHYGAAAQLQPSAGTPSWLTGNPLTAHHSVVPTPREALPQYTRVVGSNRQYDCLGQLDGTALGRQPTYRGLVSALQQELAAAEDTIHERNRQRFAPFVQLLPSRIPNGITI